VIAPFFPATLEEIDKFCDQDWGAENNQQTQNKDGSYCHHGKKTEKKGGPKHRNFFLG